MVLLFALLFPVEITKIWIVNFSMAQSSPDLFILEPSQVSTFASAPILEMAEVNRYIGPTISEKDRWIGICISCKIVISQNGFLCFPGALAWRTLWSGGVAVALQTWRLILVVSGWALRTTATFTDSKFSTQYLAHVCRAPRDWVNPVSRIMDGLNSAAGAFLPHWASGWRMPPSAVMPPPPQATISLSTPISSRRLSMTREKKWLARIESIKSIIQT